jgi:hypothetical protein
VKKDFYRYSILISVSLISLINSPLVSSRLHLRDYQAEYQLYWNGIPVGTSKHKVKELSPNHFVAQAHSFPKLKFLPYEDFESSEFIQTNKQIRPQMFFFRTQENRKIEEGTLSFNWKTLNLTKQIKKKPIKQESISPIAHDRITQFFQLREDIKNGKSHLSYTIMDVNKLIQWQFRVVGYETVDTALGPLETIKIEHLTDNKDRRTQFWLAKELDYVMVKLVQYKHGKKNVDVVIKKITPHILDRKN